MIPKADENVAVVTDQRGLSALVAELRRGDWVALDTEFVRERTYYPRLCLVQVANDERLACIDPLALEDLSPLTALLADASVTKVLHAAAQDQEILLQVTGEIPRPVFDTQVAAALLGHPDQMGYAKLVAAELDIALDKGHTRAAWDRRPLDPDELAYAADDVRYLARLYPRLRERLAERGRLAWLDNEFETLTDPARYRPDPERAWQRVRGWQRLRPGQQQALAQLAAWRERAAMNADKPRKWILKDEVLLDLARRRPSDKRGLAKVRDLPDAVVRKHGETLLERIRTAREKPSKALGASPQPLDPAQEPLVDMLMAALRSLAAEAGISPGALASRRELERMVAGERDLPVLRGWRRAAVGEALLEVLAGERRLRVAPEGLKLE